MAKFSLVISSPVQFGYYCVGVLAHNQLGCSWAERLATSPLHSKARAMCGCELPMHRMRLCDARSWCCMDSCARLRSMPVNIVLIMLRNKQQIPHLQCGARDAQERGAVQDDAPRGSLSRRDEQ